MPYYVHSCVAHGAVEVARAMAESGLPAACPVCGEPMRRIFSGQAFIMRPDGWARRPGDTGYWNFDRQRELGQLRGGSHESAVGKVPDPVTPRPTIEYSEEIRYEWAQLSQLVERHVRDNPDIPKE